MKCYAKRHALASDAMNAAQWLTKQLLEEQSDRVAVRCYNEVWAAMLQANLSPQNYCPCAESPCRSRAA